MLKFYLDNIEMQDSPTDWKDLTVRIERYKELRLISIGYPNTITLVGDGYKYVKDKFDADGFCSKIDVRIESECVEGGGFEPIIEGIIFINDCIFNNFRCEVEVYITDNSFFAKIDNNKNIDIYIESAKTKNLQDLTPISPRSIIRFDPSDGSDESGTSYGYDWLEAVNMAIKFISDGEMTAVSDWYSNLPLSERYAIVRGYELRTGDHTAYKFYLSLTDLLSDMAKWYNLWFAVDGTSIRIEPVEYFYNSSPSFNLEKIKDVKQYFQQDSFYSNIEFGSRMNFKDGGSFPLSVFDSFLDEKYHIKGVCNIDNTLNLKGTKFLIDSNTIEDCLFVPDSKYNDELFLIQYTDSVAYTFTKGVKLGVTGRFYNLELLNNAIAERYTLPGSGMKIIDVLTNTFYAQSTTNPCYDLYIGVDPLTVTDLLFTDDTIPPAYDNGGNYNSATNVYTAPTTGVYVFKNKYIVHLPFDFGLGGGAQLRVTQNYEIASPAQIFNVVCETVDGISLLHEPINGGTVTYEVFAEQEVFMNSGETMESSFTLGFVNILDSPTATICILAGSYFSCIATPDSGGEYIKRDGTDFKASLFSFDKKLTNAQFNSLRNTPYISFNINEDGFTNNQVWANNVTIKVSDLTGEFETITNLN